MSDSIKFTYKLVSRPFNIWANTEEGGGKLYMGGSERLKSHYTGKFHIIYQNFKCVSPTVQMAHFWEFTPQKHF